MTMCLSEEEELLELAKEAFEEGAQNRFRNNDFISFEAFLIRFLQKIKEDNEEL